MFIPSRRRDREPSINVNALVGSAEDAAEEAALAAQGIHLCTCARRDDGFVMRDGQWVHYGCKQPTLAWLRVHQLHDNLNLAALRSLLPGDHNAK